MQKARDCHLWTASAFKYSVKFCVAIRPEQEARAARKEVRSGSESRVELQAGQARGCSWAETALFLKTNSQAHPESSQWPPWIRIEQGAHASGDWIMISYPVSTVDSEDFSSC